jgi:hypothetical protein
MWDHERIEELISARALGGLEPDEGATLASLMEEHGPDCAECARLQAESAEVAGRLAFALDPAPVRPGLEDETVGLALGSSEPAPVPTRRRRARLRLRPLVAAAAALVLFAGGWVLGATLSEEPGVPSNATVVAFEGEPGSGTLSVAYTPGEAGAYLLGSDLPAPPEGRVYELWMIQDGAPVAGPCLVPSADGSLFAFVDAELAATDVMAVTVEPSTCSTAPTTDPVYIAEITSA